MIELPYNQTTEYKLRKSVQMLQVDLAVANNRIASLENQAEFILTKAESLEVAKNAAKVMLKGRH